MQCALCIVFCAVCSCSTTVGQSWAGLMHWRGHRGRVQLWGCACCCALCCATGWGYAPHCAAHCAVLCIRLCIRVTPCTGAMHWSCSMCWSHAIYWDHTLGLFCVVGLCTGVAVSAAAALRGWAVHWDMHWGSAAHRGRAPEAQHTAGQHSRTMPCTEATPGPW